MTQATTNPQVETTSPAPMELYVQKARLLLKSAQEPFSSGMAGVIRVAFAFSEDWEGLQKTAVFSNGTVSVDVPETEWEDMVCTIPQQVLAVAGKTLIAGVYGTDGENRVLPTVWCALGRIETGVVPAGVDALPAEIPLWAKLQKQLGDVAAANPFVAKGLSLIPQEDNRATLELNRSFAEIAKAAQGGKPVFLEVMGAVLPLTKLIAGERAEFTGPVFTTEGRTYYQLCILPATGDGVMLTLPVGSAPAADAIREALEQAKASGEFDGAAGPKGDKGDRGDDGAPGGRGTGILRVSSATTSYTTTTGGKTPVKRMKLSTIMSEAGVTEVLVGDVVSHSYYLYHIYYLDATYAYMDTYVSIRGATGSTGAAGQKGDKGDQGDDGYTPQKGIDYWTPADQEAIVQQVIAALGTPVFGTVDEQNNIILTGALAQGPYTIKYENAEGEQITIGTLSAEGLPTYTNLLPLAIDSDGTPYNGGQGWKTNTRLSSTGTESTSNATGMEVSGFIPVTIGDTLYFKNVEAICTGTNSDKCYFTAYDSNFAKIADKRNDETPTNNKAFKYDENNNIASITFVNGGNFSANIDNIAYFRFSATEISNDSIITKNEPIE